MTGSIAVIIPTLNEETGLAAILGALPGDVEVIVADGGSRDATVAIAADHGARVVQCPVGRARQMNRGAALATSDILLFLHADTLLPLDFQNEVRACLGRKGAVAGAFRLCLVGESKGLGLVAWGANLRSRLWQLPYGDQALFLDRRLFLELGGFPEVALLEDVMLVRALRLKGRIALSSHAVCSSGRRWQRRGLVRTTLLNQLIIGGFLLGLAPDFLAKLYGVRK